MSNYRSIGTNTPTPAYVQIEGEDLLKAFCKFFYLRFCVKWSVKKHCVAKILLAIWRKSLYDNSWNYNFYKFSYKPGQIARPMPIGRARTCWTSETHPIFRAHTFCLIKKKKSLDLQVFSRIGTTMKKLQWIPNTIVNTSVLFW